MKVAARFIGLLLALISVSTMTIKEAASNDGATGRPERRETNVVIQQGGPPTSFEPYVLPWYGRFDVQENQSVVVGELMVDCLPDVPTPVFEVLQPSPAFVRISWFPCVCFNQTRAKVIVAPRRGDAGKYQVVLLAGTCTGLVEHYSFTLRVKKAAQE